MQPVAINPETVRRLSADLGIDTVTELAEQSGVSRWVLYRAMRSGSIQPSHACAVAEVLKVPAAALALGATTP